MNKRAAHSPLPSHSTPAEVQITLSIFTSLSQAGAPRAPQTAGRGRSQPCCFYFYRLCHAPWDLRWCVLTESASLLWFDNRDLTQTTLWAMRNEGWTLLPPAGWDASSPSVNVTSTASPVQTLVNQHEVSMSRHCLHVNSRTVGLHLTSSVCSTTRSKTKPVLL